MILLRLKPLSDLLEIAKCQVLFQLSLVISRNVYTSLFGKVYVYFFYFFSDISKIQAGIGDKVSISIQMFCRTISGVIIAFCYGWQLALVIFAVSPLLIISAIIMFKVGFKIMLEFNLTSKNYFEMFCWPKNKFLESERSFMDERAYIAETFNQYFLVLIL